MLIKNKKASYEYFLFDEIISGIVLQGTEIKSIRQGKVSLSDSFCSFVGNELYLNNVHIDEYSFAHQFNHVPKRPRKLLLKKRELKKLRTKIYEKGFTIIPINMFINKSGLCKVTISLAKGKNNYDKRDTLRKNDSEKEMRNRNLKDRI